MLTPKDFVEEYRKRGLSEPLLRAFSWPWLPDKKAAGFRDDDEDEDFWTRNLDRESFWRDVLIWLDMLRKTRGKPGDPRTQRGLTLSEVEVLAFLEEKEDEMKVRKDDERREVNKKLERGE